MTLREYDIFAKYESLNPLTMSEPAHLSLEEQTEQKQQQEAFREEYQK